MILLFSGGLDSYIAWHFLDRPRTIYFDLGHKYSDIEVQVVKELIPTTFVDNRLVLDEWEKDDAEIPMRNAFLLMIASYYDPKIAIVCQKGEQDIPDRTPEFLSAMAALMSKLHGTHIEIVNPFSEMTKAEMVSWYINKKLPTKKLYDTWSCYQPETRSRNELHCGSCSACFRRWVAFMCNGLEDENYRHNITKWEGIPGYIKRMKDGEYHEERVKDTFYALEKVGYKL
jgi:7-cyano-7-deazaguanine synthase in queuosine biosynthesis